MMKSGGETSSTESCFSPRERKTHAELLLAFTDLKQKNKQKKYQIIQEEFF